MPSRAAGTELLRFLQHEGHLNDSQVRQKQQIRRETGLSVRQILGKPDYFPPADVHPTLKMGVLEVLRQLFLLNQFVDQKPNGECALIPILASSKIFIFLYVCPAEINPALARIINWNRSPGSLPDQGGTNIASCDSERHQRP